MHLFSCGIETFFRNLCLRYSLLSFLIIYTVCSDSHFKTIHISYNARNEVMIQYLNTEICDCRIPALNAVLQSLN